MTTFNSIGVGRTIGAGLNDLHATDFQISTNSTNGIITINLPPISDVLSERFKSGYFQLIAFLIADISGTAGTFKTTINASSGELINGVSSIDLSTNNYSALLTITSDGAWSLLSGVSTGGGGTSINPINYTVFVGKNGNDATADGSIAKPFLTVQAGMDYAYNTYVVPAEPQPSSPFIRPCVFVSAGTYNETFVLPPQICVLGEGYNHTRLVGNWSIDSKWSNAVNASDFRSTWQSIGLFGDVNINFDTYSSNEGKLYANLVRFGGNVTIIEKTTNPVSNSLIWNSCEFLGDVNFTGLASYLINCITFGGNLTLNQSVSLSATNTFQTSGGSFGNIIINSTNAGGVANPYVCDFNHSIQSGAGITINGTFSTIKADISSLPSDTLITLLGGATLSQIQQINPIWFQGGNSNGAVKNIGTLDNFDFPIIVNGSEVGRFTTDKRLFLGDTKTNNGSNAGMQYSSLIANRSQLRENQYGANNAGGGITTFKSRGLIIGDPITPAVPANNVQVGDIIQGFTAIGLTDNGAGVGLIPLAYLQRVVVVQNANGSVACDWEVSLCPLSGTTNSIRKAFGFTSEGIQKTLETANGMSGLAVLDATGTIVVANTNVKASTKFMLTVQDGGTAPTGNVYQSARVNGTSFTIKSNAGIADAGVQVYYQLYEPIV